MTREKALDRIRKLRALAERPGTKAEGEAAAARAAKMMAEHGITDVDLGAADAGDDWIEFLRKTRPAPMARPEAWTEFVRDPGVQPAGGRRCDPFKGRSAAFCQDVRTDED